MYQAGRKTELERSLVVEAGATRHGKVSRNVVYLGLTSLVTDISSEMVASVLPLYLVYHLQKSPLGFGFLDGIRQGGAAILALASGVVTDRSRRHKQVAAIGYGLSAFCNLGLLLVGGTWLGIATVTMLDRLGKGMRVVPRDALLSLSTPRESLGRAFGVHRALDTTGSMVGPIVGFALMTLLPGAFDVVFFTSFCVGLIGLGLLVTFVKNPDPPTIGASPGLEAKRVPSLRAAASLVRGAPFRMLLICGAVLGAMTISDGFVYLVLQRRVRFDQGYLPLFYVATPAIYMLLAIPMGRLGDRVGRGRVLAAGYAALLVLYGCLLMPAFGYAQLVIVVVLLGTYYACTDGVLMALVSQFLPVDLRASGLALVTTVTNVARFAASLLFGALWSGYDVRIAVSVFTGGLLLALAATGVGLWRVSVDSEATP